MILFNFICEYAICYHRVEYIPNVILCNIIDTIYMYITITMISIIDYYVFG